MKNNISNILWGFVLIIIGIIFALNALNISNINIFFDGWWTLFIIVPSFIGLFKENNKTGNMIGIIIGIILLLACQNIIDFSLIWKLFLPVLFIIIGISMVMKNLFYQKAFSKIKNKDTKLESICATFSALKEDIQNEFQGAEVNAIFGGVELHMENAKIEEDQMIYATAIFGSIDIFVPDDVNVVVNGTPIFGGVSNKAKHSKEKKKTLFIKATAIFGGIEIK